MLKKIIYNCFYFKKYNSLLQNSGQISDLCSKMGGTRSFTISHTLALAFRAPSMRPHLVEKNAS